MCLHTVPRVTLHFNLSPALKCIRQNCLPVTEVWEGAAGTPNCQCLQRAAELGRAGWHDLWPRRASSVWCQWTVQILSYVYMPGLPWWLSSKESACECRRCGFDPWVGKIPWRRNWEPTAVFLPEESHGQKGLVGYSPWVCKRVGHNLRQQGQLYAILGNEVEHPNATACNKKAIVNSPQPVPVNLTLTPLDPSLLSHWNSWAPRGEHQGDAAGEAGSELKPQAERGAFSWMVVFLYYCHDSSESVSTQPVF